MVGESSFRVCSLPGSLSLENTVQVTRRNSGSTVMMGIGASCRRGPGWVSGLGGRPGWVAGHRERLAGTPAGCALNTPVDIPSGNATMSKADEPREGRPPRPAPEPHGGSSSGVRLLLWPEVGGGSTRSRTFHLLLLIPHSRTGSQRPAYWGSELTIHVYELPRMCS